MKYFMFDKSKGDSVVALLIIIIT